MLWRSLLFLAAIPALTSCADDTPSAITVSVIGGPAKAGDPNRRKLDAPAQVMAGALLQGLVQFDAKGEIEPALAERWLVTDDGLSYIFRIRRSTWSDGSPVTAAQVAASLRASLSAANRNPIRPLFGQVREILPMTESVVELRLKEPQDELLALLADPHMVISHRGRGTGPYRLHRSYPVAKILRPVVPPLAPEVEEETLKRNERRVRGESSDMAVARFAMGNAALVLGGDFANAPLAQAAGTQERALRIDPVRGIFGLVPVRRTGPAGNAEVRQALAMAVDRADLIRRFGMPGWAAAETLMPGPIDTFIEAKPDWTALSLSERQARARALIARQDQPVQITVDLPAGPGSRLLFARLAADWRRIGVETQRASPSRQADFALIDQVAPTANAAWYLLPFACTDRGPCSAEARNALSVARRATREERARLFAEADQAIADAQLFIPLARPLRWSLVAPQLIGFSENMTGHHPLNRLGRSTN